MTHAKIIVNTLTLQAFLPGSRKASQSCSYSLLRSHDIADSSSCICPLSFTLLCWDRNCYSKQGDPFCGHDPWFFVIHCSSATSILLFWRLWETFSQTKDNWNNIDVLDQYGQNLKLRIPHLWNVTCFGFTCLFFTSTLFPHSTTGICSQTLNKPLFWVRLWHDHQCDTGPQWTTTKSLAFCKGFNIAIRNMAMHELSKWTSKFQLKSVVKADLMWKYICHDQHSVDHWWPCLLKSLYQVGTFLYVSLDVTSNIRMAHWPWM